jgi:hypothetical protein
MEVIALQQKTSPLGAAASSVTTATRSPMSAAPIST